MTVSDVYNCAQCFVMMQLKHVYSVRALALAAGAPSAFIILCHAIPVDAQVALATIVRRGVERRDWRFCGREQVPDAIEQLEVYDHCAHLHKFSLCACSH